jgi:LuxR family transcriptional regulator, maltose regulon positive regulatory protein
VDLPSLVDDGMERGRLLPFPRDALREPRLPQGFVPRRRLVERLEASGSTPLVCVVAPTGYGKTSLVVEWSRSDPRRFLWLTLDERDNEPEHLLARVGHALHGEPVALAGSADDDDRPFVLVIDDVHALREASAAAVLRRLIDRVPPPSQLVLISRRPPAIPVGRLRAQRFVTEIGTRDLAMTGAEAAALLSACGIALPPSAHDALLARTEGWPAALYLAAESMRVSGDPATGARGFGGDDALLAAYLREEVLDDLDAAGVAFLRRAAVLDNLSGAVCDAVLKRGDSGRMLAEIGEENLLLVPLDAAHRRYRWHPLLREMALGELRRIDPADEAQLHRRACDWYLGEGDRERAIDHATAGGDTERAATLVCEDSLGHITHGRNALLQRRLRALHSDRAADPRLALAAAWSHVADGDLARAQRSESAVPPPGDALLHSLLFAEYLADLRTEAARSYAGAPAQSPWRAVCCMFEGLACLLMDDAAAEQRLDEGARIAAVVAPSIHTVCLAGLALMAAERGDWNTAVANASRARAQLGHYGLEEYPTSAFALAVSALVRTQRGMLDEGRGDIRQAMRALRALGDFVPWYGAATRAVLARALARTGDVAEARECVTEAGRLAQGVPDAPGLARAVAEARAEADDAVAAVVSGPLCLTRAEMRVLRFLPTHLSFREIAGQLYVSANTVKTQAHSVYRKLEASSRSEAVLRATDLGLLAARA